jgi:DNA-binding response OmpR family regulator/predicted ATPase
VLSLTTCTVDLDHAVVHRDDGDQALTALEVRLLRHLAGHEGQDVPRDELFAAVWSHDGAGGSRAVDHAVARLRRKLGEPAVPRHLLTVHGEGYRFVAQDRPLAPAPPAPTPVAAIAVPGGALDLVQRRFVRDDGMAITLSKLECDVLQRLADAGGAPVPREQLAADVWGRGRNLPRLDALVRRLRARLGDAAGQIVATVAGHGLQLGRRADRTSHTNLVPPPSALQDRPELHAALAVVAPLLTLTGPAGIGKTRLALELGTRWLAAGLDVWFCDLGGVHDRTRLLAALAASTGGTADFGDPLARVRRSGRATVLILDNFEQLVEHAAIVAQCAVDPVRVLVTSRLPLGLDAEHVLALAPLGHDAACELFVARAGCAPDDPELHGLVDRLDGLPLAIELAAARAGSGLATLRARMADRLDLLVRRPAGSVSAHATLRGALDTSWDLLEPGPRRALARASVFAGTFDASAAGAVFGVPGALEVLVRHALVQREGDRYRLLESVRDYAAEKLVLLGLRDQALAAHRDHTLALGEQGLQNLRQRGPSAVQDLRALLPDLFAVHERQLRPGDTVRATACIEPVLGGGPLTVWRDLLLRTLETSGEASTSIRVKLAAAEMNLGHMEQGLRHAEIALASADDQLAPSLHRMMGQADARFGRFDRAHRSFVRAVEGYRARGDALGEAQTWQGLAYTTWAVGRLDEAEQYVARSLEVLSGAGPEREFQVAFTQSWWGCIRYLHLGDAAGRAWVEQAYVRAAASLGHIRPHTVRYLAEVRLVDGALDEAEALLGSFAERMVDLGFEHDASARLAAIALERGRLDDAVRHASDALNVRKADDRRAAFSVAASVEHALGRLGAALAHSDQAERLRVPGQDEGHSLHRALLLVDLGREVEAQLVFDREREVGFRWCDRRLAAACEARLAQARGDTRAEALVDAASAPDERPWFGTRPALARLGSR